MSLSNKEKIRLINSTVKQYKSNIKKYSALLKHHGDKKSNEINKRLNLIDIKTIKKISISTSKNKTVNVADKDRTVKECCQRIIISFKGIKNDIKYQEWKHIIDEFEAKANVEDHKFINNLYERYIEKINKHFNSCEKVIVRIINEYKELTKQIKSGGNMNKIENMYNNTGYDDVKKEMLEAIEEYAYDNGNDDITRKAYRKVAYEGYSKGLITLEEREELINIFNNKVYLEDRNDDAIQNIFTDLELESEIHNSLELSNKEIYDRMRKELYLSYESGEITLDERENLINLARCKYMVDNI